MACFHPVEAFIYGPDSITGKSKVCFRASIVPDTCGNKVLPLFYHGLIPCGHCLGCEQSYSRGWVLRLLCEAETTKPVYFLTLTYDDAHLPSDRSLRKHDLSQFVNSLRSRFWLHSELDGFSSVDDHNTGVRFYGVGEYGDHTFRPHYHVILFGFPINDLKPFGHAVNGDVTYTSKILSDVWHRGYVYVGEFNEASAAYVSRYCLKKQVAQEWQIKLLKDNGLSPEFALMSRRPGIGSDFIKFHFSDVKDTGSLFFHGRSYNLPRYYSGKLAEVDPDAASVLKEFSRVSAVLDSEAKRLNNGSSDLMESRGKEELALKAKIAMLKRNLL